MRKHLSKILYAFVAFLFIVATAFAFTGQGSALELSEDGVNRPTALNAGLSRKTLEEIGSRRVTIRQPIMEIVKRNVERHEPKLLSDDFALPNFETDVPYEKAVVHFDKYPSKDLNEFNGNEANRYFTNYEKYMLLRQAVYYNGRAMEDAESGELCKHPAADGIYGEIPVENNAVIKRIVTDPLYTSPLTTGLYLPAGEVAEVTVKGLREGEKLTMYTHHQDSLGYIVGGSAEAYYNKWDSAIIAESQKEHPDFDSLNIELQGQWLRQNKKVPCMGAVFTIEKDGTYKIGCPYGGPLYLKPTKSCIELTVSGAVETPHFILGVTTVEDFNENLRRAPGLIATLDCENGQLIGPAEAMRNCDDIEKLAYFWHSVFAVNTSFNGRPYNYDVTLAFDLHVPAGAAVALSGSFAAQPVGWFTSCMNYRTMTTAGNWGTLHELGHINAQAYGSVWGMKEGKEGEVRNNVLIVLIYTMLCDMDNRVVGVEHGEYTHPFLTVQKSLNLTQKGEGHDYSELDYFDMIALYATLIHSFGPEKFVDFFYTYSVVSKYCENPRADFVYRVALVDKVNILNWLNRFYYGNIRESYFTHEQLEYLESLPEFYPVAYRWANGIDGNETARKYSVDGKNPTIFDLSEGNILCPVEYSIVGFEEPRFGSINYNESNHRLVYTPPEEVTENDEFGIIVKVGEREVTLNVRLSLTYTGAYSTVWENIPSQRDVDSAIEYAASVEPSYNEASQVAGKARYNRGSEYDYINTKFSYLATESGEHSFYLRADDASEVTFTKGELVQTLTTPKDIPSYSEDRKVTFTLNEGETVLIDCRLVNWGGLGYLNVGVKKPNETTIADVPSENILGYGVTTEELDKTKSFVGFVPKFFVSVKNVSVNKPVPKDGWSVIKFPKPHPNDGADPNNMIDGDDGTLFHTKYGGGEDPMPHEFIFDTGSIGTFNYFEIVRRNHNNSIILKAELWVATENEEECYKQVYSTDALPYTNFRATINFDETEARYFKLIVRSTSGGLFTVINEVNAGLNTTLMQPVKPSNFGTKNEGFDENSVNGKLTASKKGSVFEFSFLGAGFDVFADMGTDYGSAYVFIDEEKAGEISLCGDPALNELVYSARDLEVGEHTVRIESVSDAPINIGFINVDYKVPVTKDDYPAMEEGDTTIDREFIDGWKSYVPDYRTLTEISFVKAVPTGYVDTYERMSTVIKICRSETDKSKIAFVYSGNIVAPKVCDNLFGGCVSLEKVNFDNFVTSGAVSMMSMFSGCGLLTELDLRNFGTSEVKNMSYMFSGCDGLNELTLPFSTGKVLRFNKMFFGCGRIESLDISGFDVAGSMKDAFLQSQIVSLNAPKSIKGAIALSDVYLDNVTSKYIRQITEENAGHLLTLHTDHTFGNWIEGVPSTCAKEGIKRHRICSVCGFYFDESGFLPELTLSKSEHVLSEHPYMAASCSRAGNVAYKSCEACGGYFDMYDAAIEADSWLIQPIGHGSVWTYDSAATSLENEHHIKYCEHAGCSGVKEACEITVQSERTSCNESGTEVRTCALCGYKATYKVPAGEHSYGGYTVVKEPSCVEKGKEERECVICGKKESREIETVEHTLIKYVQAMPECDRTGHGEYEECARCGKHFVDGKEGEPKVFAATGHSFCDWELIKDEETGEDVEQRHCMVCGEVETRDPSNGGIGLGVLFAVLIVVIVGCGAALAAVTIVRKKKTK